MRMSGHRVVVDEVLGDENSSAEVFNKIALLVAQAPERPESRHAFALARVTWSATRARGAASL
jgi:hypothetical protein